MDTKVLKEVNSDAIPCMHGENVKSGGQNVTYICPYMGTYTGKLTVTNYKLYFKSSGTKVSKLLTIVFFAGPYNK